LVEIGMFQVEVGTGGASVGGVYEFELEDGTVVELTVDADGEAWFVLDVPADTEPGLYALLAAVEDEVLADAVLTVTAAADVDAPGAGDDGGALPRTGASIAAAILAALLLVGIGVTLVSRRRLAGTQA
ncbi:LPXTG cell wall anchor domain-containing protein, partial [Cellulomonas bogoriensis]|uniref:LPXTG cell wall anchor domain-containing protein n=1 Tax=Cellulomonas bogoriensis TaxID=301388 RepID=UPI00054E76DD